VGRWIFSQQYYYYENPSYIFGEYSFVISIGVCIVSIAWIANTSDLLKYKYWEFFGIHFGDIPYSHITVIDRDKIVYYLLKKYDLLEKLNSQENDDDELFNSLWGTINSKSDEIRTLCEIIEYRILNDKSFAIHSYERLY
jgi:hypothetical protein